MEVLARDLRLNVFMGVFFFTLIRKRIFQLEAWSGVQGRQHYKENIEAHCYK